MTQGPSHEVTDTGTTFPLSDVSVNGVKMVPKDGKVTDEPQSWDEVETTSPTPQAEELREFADEVEEIEQVVSDEGDVDIYYRPDQTQVSIVYESRDYTDND